MFLINSHVACGVVYINLGCHSWPRKLLGEFFLKVSIYPKSDAKDPPKLLKFEKNPNFNMKYLPNGREHLNSAKTSESGLKNWICLNYYRFLGPIAEWEKGVSGFGSLEWWIAF
jgi:hypothetical protein